MLDSLKKLIGLGGKGGEFGRNARGDQPEKPEIDPHQPRSTKYYDFTPGNGDDAGKLRIKCHLFELVMEDITQLMKDPAKYKRTLVTFPDGAVFRIIGLPADIKSACDKGLEIDAKVMTKDDMRRLRQEKAAGNHHTPYALPDADPRELDRN